MWLKDKQRAIERLATWPRAHPERVRAQNCGAPPWLCTTMPGQQPQESATQALEQTLEECLQSLLEMGICTRAHFVDASPR